MLLIASLSQRCFAVGTNQPSQTVFPLASRKDSTHDEMTCLARGSVCGWCRVCLEGKGKYMYIDIRGQVHEGSSDESLRRLI